MKLTHFFVDHPRFAAVINIFITAFGLATLAALPVAQYPNIVPPTIQITTSYPGASAETIARTVATPLEQAVNGVESMDYITSQSTGNGQLAITVIFKVGTNVNTALMLTRNRVQDTLSRLPQEVQLLAQPRIHVELHASHQGRDRAVARRGGFLDIGRAAVRDAHLD